MAAGVGALVASRSRWFDLSVFVAGLLVMVVSTLQVVQEGIGRPSIALLSLPLIVLVANFPFVLDTGGGGIEVGFESAVLNVLLCTLGSAAAVFVLPPGAGL